MLATIFGYDHLLGVKSEGKIKNKKIERERGSTMVMVSMIDNGVIKNSQLNCIWKLDKNILHDDIWWWVGAS